MRISDWSSDVCSSDLGGFGGDVAPRDHPGRRLHRLQLRASRVLRPRHDRVRSGCGVIKQSHPMTNPYSLLQQHFPADRASTVLETPAGRRMSYADLEAGAGRLARLLVDCGVQPGDRVAAQIEKSPEALLLYLAVLRAGGVYLPDRKSTRLNSSH